MAKIYKINTQAAERFSWGTNCDEWFLANKPNICILQEKMPGGSKEEKHYHEHTWQFFYVITGTATMEIEASIYQLGASDGIEIPPKISHKILNNTDHGLIFLVISTPNHKSDRINVE